MRNSLCIMKLFARGDIIPVVEYTSSKVKDLVKLSENKKANKLL